MRIQIKMIIITRITM